ncbi:MAG: hypothetical protein AB8G05_21725 [Oligoflexales bacterium]
MINLHCVLAMMFVWLCFLSQANARSKELIFIRHGESHMNAVYHSNPINILYRLTRDRDFLKDANLNTNGIKQALNLHESLMNHYANGQSKLHAVAKKILYPDNSVMFLSSNLRRAANTGLIVRYSFSDPLEFYKPLHIVSALQERYLSRVFVDTIPLTERGSHLDRLFEEGMPEAMKVFEPIQEDLFTTHWNNCGSGMQANPSECGGQYYGDSRKTQVKVKDVLDLAFFDGSQYGVNISDQDTIVIFGHSLWLQQMLEFLNADTEFRHPWKLIPNCGLFHMQIENHGTEYFLKSSQLY